MVAVTEKLGVGLYTLKEAAFYSRVPVQTLNRWFYGNKQGSVVVAPQFADSEDRVITFLDFVQALAIRNIRVNHRVPLSKIREAIERARDQYGVDYPLARKKTIYHFGAEIFIHVDGYSQDFRQLTGRNRDQSVFTRVVELYMRDLGFDESGLASNYSAYCWKDREVKIDPQIRLGEPLILSCGYSARTLWETAELEGGIEAAARILGVEDQDVEAACRYWDHLSTVKAA